MKVTIQNKKGLSKDLKIFVDKKTIASYMDEKYLEVGKTIVLKGFRPGKVPGEVLKRQFGKAIYGEVIDSILKETSSKTIEEKKIWKLDDTTDEWKKENLQKIKKRLQGWQLESFEESYKYKIENGVSLIKQKNQK